MPGNPFKLEIVTPQRIIFDGMVVSFSAPGVMGGFQVLYNHAPMLAEIGVGEVKLQQPGMNEMRFATSGGFVDVNNNHVVMLAETVERAGEIDRTRAEAARERARTVIETRRTPGEFEEATKALERAQNRIRIASKG